MVNIVAYSPLRQEALASKGGGGGVGATRGAARRLTGTRLRGVVVARGFAALCFALWLNPTGQAKPVNFADHSIAGYAAELEWRFGWPKDPPPIMSIKSLPGHQSKPY